MAFAALVSGIFAWWAKSAVNERLVMEHREFLRNAKIEHKPKPDPFLDGRENSVRYTSQFSIEIDGVRTSYNQLYMNPMLIAKLDDPELYRLSKNYRNWVFICCGSVAGFLFSSVWWLA